jgi:hypothetical protein
VRATEAPDQGDTLSSTTPPSKELSMTVRPARAFAVLVVASVLCIALLGARVAPASAAQRSCGILVAAHHSWIVVAKNVTCAKAKAVTRALATRTAAIRRGQRVTVHTSLLPGYTCVLASQGKPAGSCSIAGATKMVVWLTA